MRIALIAPQPFIDVRATPMENLRMARLLSDLGHEVEVITYPLGTAPPHPGVTVRRCPRVPFVKSVGIGFSPAKLLLDISLTFHALNLARQNHFDCVHGVEEGAFIGALVGRVIGAPLAYDMDSIISQEIADSRLKWIPPLVRLAAGIERWTIRRSVVVITISQSMADHVRLIDPRVDVIVAPDVPIPPPEGGPDPGRARTQIPPQFASHRLVVYAGSFAGYQGLDMLMSAVPRVTAVCPDAAFVVIGGDEREIKRLAKAGHAGDMMHKVVFLGKKPPEEIHDFLSAADVLVSPRRRGMNPPAKIYTYMQSGTPIVATHIPAHRAVLDDDSAILVDASPQGIADGILWAIQHPEEAASRALRAEELVRRITPELKEAAIRQAYELLERKVKTSQTRPAGIVKQQ